MAPRPESENASLFDRLLRSGSPRAGNSQVGQIVVIATASLVLLVVLCLFIRWHRRVVDKEKQKNKTLAVFQYLRGMDVDDIDIRRSPAGGFHVSYLNDLAQGKNEWEEEDSGTSSGRSDASHKGAAKTSTEKTLSEVVVDEEEDEDEKKGLLSS